MFPQFPHHSRITTTTNSLLPSTNERCDTTPLVESTRPNILCMLVVLWAMFCSVFLKSAPGLRRGVSRCCSK